VAHPDRAPLMAGSAQGRWHVQIQLPHWREESAQATARSDPALPGAGSVQARSDVAPLVAGSTQGQRHIRIKTVMVAILGNSPHLVRSSLSISGTCDGGEEVGNGEKVPMNNND
jgi:hypothetical protein